MADQQAIGEAFLTLRPNVDRFRQQTEAGLGPALKDIGKFAAGMIGAQLGMTLAQSIKDSIGGAIRESSLLKDSVNAVDVVFKDSASAIHDWGRDNAAAMGLTRRAFNEAATPMGAFLKNMGFSTKESADATLMLTKRGIDLTSVYGGTAKDAMDAFNSALRGEMNPLERYAVGITAAMVSQRAMEMTGKANAEQLTRTEKAQATLALIMEQSNDVAGDYANTSNELENVLRREAAASKELSERIGSYLLPITTAYTASKLELKQAITKHVLPALEGMGGGFVDVARAVFDNKELMAGIAGVLTYYLAPALWTAATASYGLAAGAIKAGLSMAIAAAPALAVAAAIGGVTAGVVWLWRNWDDVWTRLPEGVQGALQAVRGFGEGFVSVMKTTINWFIDQLNKIQFKIPDWVPGLGGKEFGINLPKVEVMFEALANVARGTVGAVRGAVDRFTSAMGGAGGQAAAAAPAMDELRQAIAGASGEAVKATRTIADAIEAIEKDSLNRRIAAYLKGGEDLAEQVRVQNAQQFQDALGLADKLHMLYGIDLPDALDTAMKHIRDSADEMKKAAEDALKKVKSDAFELTRTLWGNAGSGMGAGQAAGLAAMAEAAARGITGSLDAAGNFTANLPKFDLGGVVPGPFGSPVPILAHAGETVLPTHRGGGGTTIIRVEPGYHSGEDFIVEGIVAAVQRGRLPKHVLGYTTMGTNVSVRG